MPKRKPAWQPDVYDLAGGVPHRPVPDVVDSRRGNGSRRTRARRPGTRGACGALGAGERCAPAGRPAERRPSGTR